MHSKKQSDGLTEIAVTGFGLWLALGSKGVLQKKKKKKEEEEEGRKSGCKCRVKGNNFKLKKNVLRAESVGTRRGTKPTE
jgi:hypothetical protein